MAEIIVVASGKGGSGKSSFTAGLGRALAFAGKKFLQLILISVFVHSTCFSEFRIRWFTIGATL